MKHVCTIRLILLFNSIYSALTSKVVWLPNRSFDLPSSFENGKLPCSTQTVVFPVVTLSSVAMKADVSVGALVLPVEGELVLGDGVIGFGPGDGSNCTDTGNTFYMEKVVSTWYQPDVWFSSRFNEATPDAERMPCFYDEVEFPENAHFTIVLPVELVYVRGIKIGGKYMYGDDFNNYIHTQTVETQQFVLNKYMGTGAVVEYHECKSLSGCPCQEEPPKIDCALKFCPKPSCVDPIQPVGHCCKICGGEIVFDIESSFNISKFKEHIEKVVESNGVNSLTYHIGRLQSNKVQLVVVDKGGYSGNSAQVVNDIARNLESRSLKATQISGGPLDSSGLGGRIFVSVFLLVVLVMSGIYVYYYKLDIRIPVIGNTGAFLRYNQRTESIVSLTRRDSSVAINPGSSRNFRNPLYNSKRGRVTVEESVMKEED